MSEKVSFKTILVISLILSGIVLILGACMDPVNIDSFLNDPEVGKIIEKNSEHVILDAATKTAYPYLNEGNKRITGLALDQYYMIESVKNENFVEQLTKPKYVYDSGLSDDKLLMIERVKGGNITGLTNGYIYKIRETASFTGSVVVTGAGTAEGAVSEGGVIKINPTGTGDINIACSKSGYIVMAVAVDPPSLSISTPFIDGELPGAGPFKLEGAGTKVDYVFVKEASPIDFIVLRVEVGLITVNKDNILGVNKPVAGQTPVTEITENDQYTGTVSWLPKADANGKFAANTPYTATIKLTPKKGYTLTGVSQDFFNVPTATGASNAANSDSITAMFSATEITIGTPITGITPVFNGTPQTTINLPPQYTGTVEWSPDPALTGGKFDANTSYTATIKLTPNAGYTVYGIPGNYSTLVPDAELVTNDANSDTITAKFQPTIGQGSIDVSITYTANGVSLTGSSASITIGATKPSDTLSLGITGGTIDSGSIEWYHNGTLLTGTDITLSLNNSTTNPWVIVGRHIFTVTVKVGGDPYSASFTLDVTQ
jgi:hypothetical protein